MRVVSIGLEASVESNARAIPSGDLHINGQRRDAHNELILNKDIDYKEKEDKSA